MLEPLHEPIPVFLTLVTVILIMPLLSERVRLPGLIGLVLGGMLVGPHGTGLLSASGSIELLATVGLLYLMFSAGLEIDLRQLGRVRNKAMLFGLLTFLLPQLSGVALGRGFGLGWSAAVLLGSVYASHTLLAFPILSHLDILSNEAVAVTVGATLFTDVASLLVLGIVAGSGTGGGSASFIVQLIVLMGLFTILVLAVLPKLVRHFFHRFSGRAIKLQFVLVTLLLSAWVAEHIGMHAIIGAFLAGLAINSAVSAHSPVVGQVLYIGESLFIPMFLMYVGMITDPLAIVASRQALVVGLVLTAAVYLSKLGAAWIVGRIFGYSRDETLTMWGLSQAQAAATLATILVGVEIRLFPAHVFNGAILMIICTSVSSPLLTQKFGARLSPAEEEPEERGLFERIIVAVANPQTEQHLIALAGILACRSGGVLMPTNVARVVDGEVVGLERQRKLLNAPVVSDCQAEVQRIARVDASITEGVLHAALENEATLIVMGWRGRPTLAESILDGAGRSRLGCDDSCARGTHDDAHRCPGESGAGHSGGELAAGLGRQDV